MQKGFSALVCGYGVPEDILTDRSYHAYLVGVTNWLFDRYRDASGRIVLVGGPTDIVVPSDRTESGEMARWFKKRLTDLESWTGYSLRWKIIVRPRALSSVENLLAFKPFVKDETVVFCETTRATRVRKLTRAVLGTRNVRVVPIDFDGSPRRYQPIRNGEQEAAFLKMELHAARDPGARRKLRAMMREKLARMRKLGPKKGHEQLPQILTELLAKYAD